MTFSVIEKLTQLRDVLTGDRADGRLLAWSDAADAHVYIDPPAGNGGGGGGLEGSGFAFDGGDATGQESAFFDGGSA